MAKLLEHLPCEKKLREFAYSIWKRDSFGSHVVMTTYKSSREPIETRDVQNGYKERLFSLWRQSSSEKHFQER